ncbi:TIGR02647 family protein [Permianibacter aggregans]|uniref:Uncharacterized protein (TIGR02647 family) n=1 Tax=Permianibacter aggregans TaxID=1510150 RepID=A0A4R6UWL9_9GAMM|nr:TIGR02647 family protein [Permianibacter aggregans]QGX38858.1 TIGR02647 family protein [Permianibacter aggregans]TDQ50666.1 uncharacterized protein (TIGR02647 family) [Permianibacter aggregans]
MFSGESFDELMAEIRLLLQFPRNSRMAGIKLHRDAEADMHQAAQRLHQKGIISQVDGGYLTDRGIEAANYAHWLVDALKPTMH